MEQHKKYVSIDIENNILLQIYVYRVQIVFILILKHQYLSVKHKINPLKCHEKENQMCSREPKSCNQLVNPV